MWRGRRVIGDETLGGLFVALASFQFGGLVVVGKAATDGGLPVSTMLALRFAIAAAVLAAALALTGQRLRAARGEGARLALLGVGGYAGEALLFFLAVERGTATAVTLLFFTYPVVVTLLSLMLGLGRPRAIVVGALAAAVAGTTIVVGGAGGIEISATGIALALGSAGMFALYLVGAQVWVRATSSLASSLWVSAFASAGLAVTALATGARLPDDAEEWWRIAAMGLFTAGAFFCLFAGLRLLGAVRTAIVAALEPLSTALLAAIFLGEALRGPTIVGGGLILAAAVVASIARAARPLPRAAETPGP